MQPGVHRQKTHIRRSDGDGSAIPRLFVGTARWLSPPVGADREKRRRERWYNEPRPHESPPPHTPWRFFRPPSFPPGTSMRPGTDHHTRLRTVLVPVENIRCHIRLTMTAIRFFGQMDLVYIHITHTHKMVMGADVPCFSISKNGESSASDKKVSRWSGGIFPRRMDFSMPSG